MKLLFFLFLFVSVKPLLSQMPFDSKPVINIVIDSLKEFNLSLKYSNYSIKSYLRYNDSFNNDTFLFAGLYFPYSSSIKLARKMNHSKIRGIEIKPSKNQRNAYISIPIFTFDRRHSIVFIDTSGGGYCGTSEIFILEKKSNNWEIVNRQFW